LVRQYECKAIGMGWVEVRPRPAEPSAKNPTRHEDASRP
jgi:hypothetical protein